MNNNEYKHTKTTVSLINYHIIFCPRYRRKIFNIEGVEERFIAMECDTDHAHIFLSAWPQQDIPWIVKQIKGATSKKLREEFEKLSNMPSLWTRSYFVSTAGKVSSETIRWYVEQQKKRY